MGMGDLLTHRVWAKIHKPNARDLSITMLSQGSVEEAWKNPDKTDSTKEFETEQELRMAVATLDAAIHRVMMWNFAFTTIHLFLVSINFGESELARQKSGLQFLSNFIDEEIRANARNWEERKVFLSNQDLCARWTANLTRKGFTGKGGANNKGKSENTEKPKQKVPGWVCRSFNEGTCKSKDDKHPSDWNPGFFLRHVCNKWVPAKKKHCLEAHAVKDHK
jgi:hypothetical protein